jgi:hypothetical protein
VSDFEITDEMADAAEIERESHRYRLLDLADDPIQAVCSCGKWQGPYAVEFRRHREKEGLRAALEAAKAGQTPEYIVIRDSAGAPLYAVETVPIPKPENVHNLGREHGGYRYCMDKGCNHYEPVEDSPLGKGDRVEYYRDDTLVGSVVEVEARRTRAGEPISVYAVLWDEEIRPSRWYSRSDLKAL